MKKTTKAKKTSAQVAVIMGSQSDWETMKAACDILADFDISFEKKVLSAHRTPDDMREFAINARSNGIKVVIAGAGGAAHLPGMTASYTTLPVIGVPVKSKSLDGMDSLLSIVQMPKGVPVATVSIGNSANAALLALQMLAIENATIAKKLEHFRLEQSATVKKMKV